MGYCGNLELKFKNGEKNIFCTCYFFFLSNQNAENYDFFFASSGDFFGFPRVHEYFLKKGKGACLEKWSEKRMPSSGA